MRKHLILGCLLYAGISTTGICFVEANTYTTPESLLIEADSSNQIILPQSYIVENTENIQGDFAEIEEKNSNIQKFEITAYTLAEEECGKDNRHPEYGLTASMTEATQWRTIAAPKSIPFGTKVYIPYFKDYPNKGIFVVEDRGGAITEGHIDVFMNSYYDAIQFGRQTLEVEILE